MLLITCSIIKCLIYKMGAKPSVKTGIMKNNEYSYAT